MAQHLAFCIIDRAQIVKMLSEGANAHPERCRYRGDPLAVPCIAPASILPK